MLSSVEHSDKFTKSYGVGNILCGRDSDFVFRMTKGCSTVQLSGGDGYAGRLRSSYREEDS